MQFESPSLLIDREGMLPPEARLARIAERQHSVFTLAQANTCGLDASALARRVNAGRLERIHMSVLRISGHPFTYEARAMAAVLAAGAGAVASYETAAKLLRLEDVDGYELHITVPRERRARIPGVEVHHPVALAGRDRTRIGVIPITSPSRTIIDLAETLSESVLENAVDDARRRQLIDIEGLARRVERMSPHGRRGVLLLRRLLEERVGQPVPGSKWETRLKRMLVSAGLPVPIAQYAIYAPDGRFIGRPDLVYPEARLFIEFEGYAFHSSRIAWEDGLGRQNELVGVGYVPLCITKRMMENTPDRIIRLVSGRLMAAGAM